MSLARRERDIKKVLHGAEKAERAGRLPDALMLYKDALGTLNGTNNRETKSEALSIHLEIIKLAGKMFESQTREGKRWNDEVYLLNPLNTIAFSRAEAGRLYAELGREDVAFEYFAGATNIYIQLDLQYPNRGYSEMAKRMMKRIGNLGNDTKPLEEEALLETARY